MKNYEFVETTTDRLTAQNRAKKLRQTTGLSVRIVPGSKRITHSLYWSIYRRKVATGANLCEHCGIELSIEREVFGGDKLWTGHSCKGVK